MNDRFIPILGTLVAVAFGAASAGCASSSGTPVVSDPTALRSHGGVGKLEISRSGSGLLVKLINPKDGAASSTRSYQTEKANCNGHAHPCYVFSAIDGTAPMPVSASACDVDKLGGLPTAFCSAAGISSVIIDAPTGGTIGYDASSSASLGKNCFPSSLIYEVGDKDVYSVLAWDGCKETIRCAGHNVGTVDADGKDVIVGRCYYVQRH